MFRKSAFRKFFIVLSVVLIGAALPMFVLGQTTSIIIVQPNPSLKVNPVNIDLGTVFPNELIPFSWEVGLSDSFKAQDLFKKVKYITTEEGTSELGVMDMRSNIVSTLRSASETLEPQDIYNDASLDTQINDLNDLWTKTFLVTPIEGNVSQAWLAEHGSFSFKSSRDFAMQIKIVTEGETDPTTTTSEEPEEITPQGTTTASSSTFPKTGLGVASIIMMLLALVSLVFSRRFKEA